MRCDPRAERGFGSSREAALLYDRGRPEYATELTQKLVEELLPSVEVLDGQAEELPLRIRSVDVAVVGNAFHSFDGDAAVNELARALKPGGGLGVIWNIGLATEPPAHQLDAFVVATTAK
jgi:ubiquinone/menaquinone biosynthesis C-methylase UbiE